MELGVYTFGEVTPDAVTGEMVSPAQRLRDLIEEIALADQVGLDVFGVGEHHRPDYSVSAPGSSELMTLTALVRRTRSVRSAAAARTTAGAETE